MKGHRGPFTWLLPLHVRRHFRWVSVAGRPGYSQLAYKGETLGSWGKLNRAIDKWDRQKAWLRFISDIWFILFRFATETVGIVVIVLWLWRL